MKIENVGDIQRFVDEKWPYREDVEDSELYDLIDGTCTNGYDNDGSTGREIFNNGFALGVEAARKNLRVFIVSRGMCDLFFLGKDVEDVIKKLKEA